MSFASSFTMYSRPLAIFASILFCHVVCQPSLWLSSASAIGHSGTCNQREIYQSPACIYKADSIDSVPRTPPPAPRAPGRHKHVLL